MYLGLRVAGVVTRGRWPLTTLLAHALTVFRVSVLLAAPSFGDDSLLSSLPSVFSSHTSIGAQRRRRHAKTVAACVLLALAMPLLLSPTLTSLSACFDARAWTWWLRPSEPEPGCKARRPAPTVPACVRCSCVLVPACWLVVFLVAVMRQPSGTVTPSAFLIVVWTS